MTTAAKAWRVGVLLAFVAALLAGTFRGNDRWWPIGPMVMFAFSVNPDGEVHSLGLEADTVAGEHVVVPLGAGGIGLERAEIEGQATRIIAQPRRLQGVAVAASRSLPKPRYRTIYLVDTVSQLRNGEVVGSARRVIQARWQVVDPDHPKDLS
ncbi:hypothetical protein [Calidifontibacter terrae]